MSDRKIVKQDYKLVNARYKLTSNEIKIIMNAITEIDVDDSDFKKYRISLFDISSELQNASLSNKHSRLKSFCENLLRKPLYIPKDKGFLVLNWFSSLEYIQGSSEIEYEISPKLKPYLLHLKERFVKYNLKYILPLTSIYSIRIYQFIKEYEKAQKRMFELSHLQDLLQVPKSYRIYNRFKEKVLHVAQKELIEHCDIFFEYDEIKNGRKVEKLLFRVKKNDKIKEYHQSSLFPEPTPLEKRLSKYINKPVLTANGTKTIMTIHPQYKEDDRVGFKILFLDGTFSKCLFFSELDFMTGYSDEFISLSDIENLLKKSINKKLTKEEKIILEKYNANDL